MSFMNYRNRNMMGMNNQWLNQQNFMPMNEPTRYQIMNDSFYNSKPYTQNINNHQNISVFFRQNLGANGVFEIRCNLKDTVSKIIQIYRKKSGDFSLNREFMYNEKLLNPSLSLADEGIANNGTIFVSKTGAVKGGGGMCMMFTDVSKNKTTQIEFSPDAPNYRHVIKGINICGICNYIKCLAYEKEVIVNFYNKTFDLIKDKNNLFCPECQAPIEPKTVLFYLCRYQIYGKKIKNDEIVPFRSQPAEARNENSATYFDPDLNGGEVEFAQLKFEVLEYF